MDMSHLNHHLDKPLEIDVPNVYVTSYTITGSGTVRVAVSGMGSETLKQMLAKLDVDRVVEWSLDFTSQASISSVTDQPW